ncbi:hypothetical protein ACJX0J_014638, partial [Zea mays]
MHHINLILQFISVALGGIGRTIDFLWTVCRTGDAIMGVLTDMKASFQEAMQHATILWYAAKPMRGSEKDFAFATIYRHVVFDLNIFIFRILLLARTILKILAAVCNQASIPNIEPQTILQNIEVILVHYIGELRTICDVFGGDVVGVSILLTGQRAEARLGSITTVGGIYCPTTGADKFGV